jgi:hypothetical protein
MKRMAILLMIINQQDNKLSYNCQSIPSFDDPPSLGPGFVMMSPATEKEGLDGTLFSILLIQEEASLGAGNRNKVFRVFT